jgi:hypothetical protein
MLIKRIAQIVNNFQLLTIVNHKLKDYKELNNVNILFIYLNKIKEMFN